MKYSTIETDRIVLRFLTHNDIDDMLLYRNNINVSKYQGFGTKLHKRKHERIYKHIFN
jgi:hypothetical protein